MLVNMLGVDVGDEPAVDDVISVFDSCVVPYAASGVVDGVVVVETIPLWLGFQQGGPGTKYC